MNLILPLTFLTISFTIEAPDKSLSIWTPRYLTDFCDLMAFPLHCTIKSLTLFNFLYDPNITDTVFPRCKDSLLSISHLLQFSSSEPKTSLMTSGFLCEYM